jgi:hypothetical protein
MLGGSFMKLLITREFDFSTGKIVLCQGQYEIPPPNRDVIAIMYENAEESMEHSKNSKNEARMSFYVLIVSFILGVSSIVFAVCWYIIASSTTPLAIASFSSIFFNGIAGTALYLRKQSLAQSNHCSAKSSRDRDILLCITLAEKMTEEKRDGIYQDITKNVLKNISEQS